MESVSVVFLYFYETLNCKFNKLNHCPYLANKLANQTFMLQYAYTSTTKEYCRLYKHIHALVISSSAYIYSIYNYIESIVSYS